MVRKRILLAQNFFRDRHLVAAIIEESSLSNSDVVYEIGPGEGIITAELAKVASKVVAIEKDPELAAKLREKFKDVGNVEICEADFLRYDIRDRDYKIFSNIPFSLTAEIMRKILYTKNSPKEAYLVMQKEAGEKFSGKPKETEFAVLVQPWFDITITRQFRRTDFWPVPNADVVLVHVKKRAEPLISPEHAVLYRKFVKYGFGAWKKDLKTAYKRIFTHEQWKRLSRDLGFSLQATPTELSFEQWLGLFNYFMKGVPDFKRKPIYD